MPKSATMENRQNLEQQLYATVQRKTPSLTQFSSGYEVDTIEQLKKAVRSQGEKIPETAADISRYATSNFQTMPMGGLIGRNTIGRKETLRLSQAASVPSRYGKAQGKLSSIHHLSYFMF